MSARNDITLLIRAKDEATAAFQAATRAIEAMVREAGDAGKASRTSGTQLQAMATSALAVDKALALLTGRLDGANAGLARQGAAIAASKQRLADLKGQMEGAARAAQSLQTAIVDASLDGLDVAPLRAQLQSVQSAMVGLGKESAQVQRTLVAQQTTFDTSAAGLAELEARTTSLGTASQFAQREAQQLADQLERRERTAARNAQVMATVNQSTGVSRDRGDLDQLNAQIREEAAHAAEQEVLAIQRLKNELNPLAVLEQKLAVDTERLANWQRQGKITADEHAIAIKRLGNEFERMKRNVGRGLVNSKGRASLLGLTPFEMQNLSFQINDVFTQLASGTGIMQTMAQQSGQIIQIFPRMGNAIVAGLKNPYILAATVSVIALGAAFKGASDNAERLRKVEGILASMRDATARSAEQMAETVRQVERLGLSSEEALSALREMVRDGLNVDNLERFATTARDVADITGQKLPDALGEVTAAFSGGYKQIAALDDKLQALSTSEREEIRVLFESGRAAEGRDRAFALMASRLEAIAQKERGAWTNATRALDKSWNDLLNTLGRTDFAQGFISTIDGMLDSVTELFTKTNDLTLDQINGQLAALKQQRESNGPSNDAQKAFGIDIDAQIRALEQRRDALQANARATNSLTDTESAATAKRRSDTLAQIKLDRELEESSNSARRVAIRVEKAYQEALNETGDIKIAEARADAERARARREEARRVEQETQRRNAEFAKAIDNQGRAGLIDTASRFVGMRESRASDRSTLQDFFKAANVNVDPKMVAWCAAFVNSVLATNGLPTVAASGAGSNLRARDFLSFGQKVTEPEAGDIVIIKRGASGGHVGFFQGFTDRGDVRVLGGNQSNGVNTSTFKKEDVLGFRRAPSLGDVATQEADKAEKLIKSQDDLNSQIDGEVEQRLRNIDAMRDQQKLSGEALLDAQREAAVLEAFAQIQNQIAGTGLTLDEKRAAEIRKSVEAEFDLQHARDRATAALDAAGGERSALVERLDIMEKLGNAAGIRDAETAVSRLDDVLRGAIDKAIEFWKALGDTPEARTAILGLENARKRLEGDARDRSARRVQGPVDQLQQQRNGLQEQIQFFGDQGDVAVVEQLKEHLKALDSQFLAAIDSALAFWKTQTGPEAQAALLGLENLRNQLIAAQNEFVITAGQVQDAFAGSLTDGFKVFAQQLVETRDVLGSLATGALTFAQSFIEKLAEMGISALALKAATKLGFGGVADGFNQALGLGNTAALTAGAASLTAAGATVTAGGTSIAAGAAALGVSAAATAAAAQLLLVANAAGSFGIAHSGGIAGLQSRSRSISPAWFAGAARYHSGGVAGLRPNEVPIIAERGEEILTRSDPRHRKNGGLGSSGSGEPLHLSQILAIGEEQITKAMRSAGGRQVILTTINSERETIRTMLR